jgi:formylglycine-generating enzyme required for sulfatase activity
MQSMPPPSSAEASLVVHTSPAQSRVFINNVYVGTSDASGNLTISSIRQGAHQLRVIQNGYAEWESQIQCTPPSSRADVVLRSLLGAGSPEASGDHLAGTISESSMARMPKEPSYATMEAARLRAQAEALDQQARQEADDQRREQERYEQERRDRLAREELAREEELKIQAQEEKKQAEAEARRKSEEEAARLRADAESARERAETETLARQKAEEEVARHRAEAEAARQRAEVEAEARRRAEEDSARWHAEEEAKKVAEASEAKRRAEQERLRREDEERKRIEIEAKLKHEQAQREELERAVLAAAERERQARDQMSLASVLAQGGTVQSPRVDLESTADQERAAATQSVGMASHPTIDQQKTWQQNQSSVHRSMPPGVAAKKKPAVAVLLVLVGVFIVAIAGGGFAVYKFVIAPGPAPTPKPGPVKPTPSPEASVKKPVADMVSIPGGTFKMGLDDGPAQSQPAHSVSVSPFSIDRTEVTNAEYAEFVKQDNYPAPADWVDGKPKAGQERWPIASISQEDAKAFAGWRTKRDGVSYRLPTEEEWEYAARGGDQELLYPWGNDWLDNRAVIGVLLEPRAVGSLPNGKSRWGVVDMIGNVWEWTSTTVTMYADSPYVLKKEHASWVIFRGGSYASNPNDPEKPITNAYRNWVPASTKDPTLGFRLVRDGN